MGQDWRQEFREILEGSTLAFPRAEEAIAFKRQHLPKRIYKYRKDCPESRDCFETGTIWMAAPDSYNDPYDCSIMLPSAPLKRLLESRLVKQIVKAHNLENHLNPEQIDKALSSSEPIQTIIGYFPTLPGATQNGDWSTKAAYASSAVSGLANAAVDTIAEWRKSAKVCCFSEVPDSLLMWSHYGDHHRGGLHRVRSHVLGRPKSFLSSESLSSLVLSRFLRFESVCGGAGWWARDPCEFPADATSAGDAH